MRSLLSAFLLVLGVTTVAHAAGWLITTTAHAAPTVWVELRQVAPGLSGQGAPHGRKGNPIPSSKSTQGNLLGCELQSRYEHLLLRELSSRMVFTQENRTATMAPLLHHVVHVILLRSQKEMIDVNARRIVTMVADGKPVGDLPVSQFPSHTTCLKVVAVVPDTSVTVNGSTCPNNASVTVGRAHVSRKPYSQFRGRVWKALSRAILAGCRIFLEPCEVRLKPPIAGLTDTRGCFFGIRTF